MEIDYPEGATPLDPNETDGLIPSISTQAQLNILEKKNILVARTWALKSRKLKKELLSYSGLCLLHQRMFNQIWSWAGAQRISEKSLGVAPHLVAERIEDLCRDVQAWLKYKTYPTVEIALRFHHRLVSIHPFPNGNGRHARLATDLLLSFTGNSELNWGRSELVSNDEKRKQYIKALQTADKSGDYQPLIIFAQS